MPATINKNKSSTAYNRMHIKSAIRKIGSIIGKKKKTSKLTYEQI